MVFAVSIVGKSDTGKTRLIMKLVPELVGRGYKIAVVKDCPHGFDLDAEGKDSWNFTRVGAQGVMLNSPKRIGLIKNVEEEITGKILLEKYFHDFDIVLIEGLRDETGIKKIELLRRGIHEIKESLVEETIAYVCDFNLEAERPVFTPDDIVDIADLIEGYREE